MESLDTPTEAVVDEVAATEGVDPTELAPPLFEVIDTDALNSLLESTGSEVTVHFRYNDYDITVDQDYTVELEPVGEDQDSPSRSNTGVSVSNGP